MEGYVKWGRRSFGKCKLEVHKVDKVTKLRKFIQLQGLEREDMEIRGFDREIALSIHRNVSSRDDGRVRVGVCKEIVKV